MKNIHLWGVKQNNLKNIEVKIPLKSFTVICGPSGSGKSSLAFETIYAEGQRRYIESLSNYTKQFLNKAPKPDIDGIENIPPSLALEQKNSVKSSRSTVGTTTETIDYLRLLYEKIGKAYCPDHHIPFEKDTVTSAADKTLKIFNGQRGYILCPVYANGRTLTGRKLYTYLQQEGILRIYKPGKAKTASKKKTTKKKSTKKAIKESQEHKIYDKVNMGKVIELSDSSLRKSAPKTDFYIVIDRMAFKDSERGRIADSIRQAYSFSLKLNKELMTQQCYVLTTDAEQLFLSEDFSCSVCGIKFPNISSRLFSFNSPVGACPTCNGFGNTLSVDEAKVVPNPNLTLAQGCLQPFAMPSAKADRRELNKFCKSQKIDLHTPWSDLPAKHRKMIWDGHKDFYGVLGLFKWLETKKYKMHVRVFISRFKSPFTCKDCGGTRLRKESQQVLIHGESITDITALTIDELYDWVQNLELNPNEKEICAEAYDQLSSRLFFLKQVGVGYLSLDRPTRTLSGGEYQRLNLSNQLGMGLSQTLYVLDEPTIGLHPRDNHRLIQALKKLNSIGNTLVIVEHDHDVIHNSDHVIEIGPGSGSMGGEVVYAGPTKDFYESPHSNTTQYLKPNPNWVPLRQPRPVDMKDYKFILDLKKCSGNNLKNIDVQLPLNRLVTVTGVSGSGKSSLVSSTLYPSVARALGLEYKASLPVEKIIGLQNVKNIQFIDQTPVGKTARSSPVTYLKVYDEIRKVMASTYEAKQAGFAPGAFSLNVDGGRCPVCKGLGFEVIDMMFMDDIHITCDACDGKKFRDEVLEIKYRNKNIYEILNLTVADAMNFFVSHPNIRRPLSILKEVGLDYIRLGQSAASLSGGESQRLKIAREFNFSHQKSTLYIMDEPTTGLHFREVHLLLKVLNRLVDSGNSVLLIEHNLEVIRNSDFVIDIGPEAGDKGGQLVASGTPEKLMKTKRSITGKYLKEYIDYLNPPTSRPKASHPKKSIKGEKSL